ncbi:unnamed protein product [Orchesella dallaii]|uniref:EKC/KEOPS complex subunit CGI121 n=1 Tax=Orchesella dallaii TaxID=48710 RepID=A0ABP1R7J3_9HEXA
MDFDFAEHQDNLIRKLYTNVQNTAEIRKVIFAAKLPFTLINPELVLDPFQLSVAMTKALYNMKEGSMMTRSFQTEILYCLSPNKNITEALTSFGSKENDSTFILIGEKQAFVQLEHQIQGKEVPLSEVSQFSKEDTIKQMYQIPNDELQNSTLLKSIVSRISSKEFATG